MVIMSLVIPFGLIDTLEILIDLMNGVILLYLDRFVIIFIDNIWCIWITMIIIGSDWEWNCKQCVMSKGMLNFFSNVKVGWTR